MFGEMSLFAWMGGAIVFAIGGGAGFFIARQIKDQRTLELEKQLESTKNALSEYQQDVNNHFLKTSLLFNKLTDDYREVYEHLATGAQKLCNEKPLTQALDLPETKILAASTAASQATAANSETNAAQTSEHDKQHETDEHGSEEHLGAQTAGNTANLHAETAEIETSNEAASAQASQTEDVLAETASAETGSPAAHEEDAPQPSEEELKTLEAEEKKKADEEDIHLGAESTPGVDVEHHKTHPSIH